MQTTADGESLETLRKEAEIAGNVVMPCGQHVMKQLRNTETAYLGWVARAWKGAKIRRAAMRVLEGRRYGVVQYIEIHDLRQFPATRSATMSGETPWQIEMKRRCGSDGGFEIDIPVARGNIATKADLVGSDGREVILLDLRRKDDVARAMKVSSVCASPRVILNAEGAVERPPTPGNDGEWSVNLGQEAREVWMRLMQGAACRMNLWVDGEVLEPLNDEATTTRWMKTENEVVRRMMDAERDSTVASVENGNLEDPVPALT